MGGAHMLASALVNGNLVCIRTIRPEGLARQSRPERWLAFSVPRRMFHDLVRDAAMSRHDLGSLSRLGYAGMCDDAGLGLVLPREINPDFLHQPLRFEQIYNLHDRDHLRG